MIPTHLRRSDATVLAELRAATGPAHEALSGGLSPEELCADRGRYVAFLSALHGFHLAAEQALARTGAVIAPPAVPRSTLIARDLQVLGARPRAASPMPWPVALTEPGAAWGVVYVVEGSALGGLLLAKLARRHLDLGPSSGAGFFASGAGADHRWRVVKAELSAPADAAWAPAALAAATATFEALAGWMAAHELLAPSPAPAPGSHAS